MAADDYHLISKHGKTAAASAVSPNSIKKPKDRVPAKPDMPEVNRFLMCQLCSGYLIDATAIIECQHTFCKSCILKYLGTNCYCPICDVQLNKAKPHLSLRSDVIIQRLVYKLVPGLLASEIRRRRDFSIKNGMDCVEASELASNSIAEEIEAASDMSTILSLDDVVSLSIEYFRSSSSGDDKTSSKVADTNGKQPPQQQQSTTSSQSSQQNQKSSVKSNSGSGTTVTTKNNASASPPDTNSGTTTTDKNSEQANDRRYLQCPAAVSVAILKKLIRMKYGLSHDQRIDLLYNGDRDNILECDLTLLDVAFIFKWNKDEPMLFQYRIFEKPVKSVAVFPGMKRPAPSVMDEPPDDDTASGPHSRSSMFSSSAPASKLARLADNTGNSGNQGSVPNNNTSGKSTTTSSASASTTTSATSSSALTSASAPTSTSTSNSTSTLATTTSTASKQNKNCSSAAASVTPTVIKLEREDEEDVDDDDEDEEEDYELVERKEHMRGIKSARRQSIKESLKRSVAASNLRSSQVHSRSASSAHSTDSKGMSESSSHENSLSSSNNSSGKHGSVSSKSSSKRANSFDSNKGKLGSSASSKGISSERLRLRVSSSPPDEHQSSGSLKLSISTSGVTPVVSSSSTGGDKKVPLKLSLGSVLANQKGSKSPERKHHKHKHHHHHHKLRHRDKTSKGVASATINNNQNPLKISFTLSPPSRASHSQGNQSHNSSGGKEGKASAGGAGAGGSSKDSEKKEQQQQGMPAKIKPHSATHNNFNNSARTSASAHGHLNNISKSISVSVSTNASSNNTSNSTGNSNNGGGSSGNTASCSSNNVKGNKILSPAELIPKNTGIEIQPTTIPLSSSHNSQISQHSMHSGNSSGGNSGASSNVSGNNNSSNSNNNSHKHSHPLLPDSVHVPKSVTLIPVNNPNQLNLQGSGTTMNSGKGNNQEKAVSGSQQQSHPNRINSHTFTHPITNKSLHQITVTEVPPPQKVNGAGIVGSSLTSSMTGGSSNNNNANNNNNSNNNNAGATNSISGSSSNPIEKVIASKPQFNGPGSMEITKIYCGTSKENAAKKLKDRKGLDITTITGSGINVSVNKPSQKLEEALRQKVNMAIGGNAGSISVTPAPNNSQSMMNHSSGAFSNKMKSGSATAASLLSGKMPPGITIGPATVPTSSASNAGNNNASSNMMQSNNSNASQINSSNMNMNSNSGNNVMKGLGFTLPPHLTAHPHIPNHNMKTGNLGMNKPETNKNVSHTLSTNNSRLLSKEMVSMMKGNNGGMGGGGQIQAPPPVEITISASGNGGKNQTNITRGGISIVNKGKMGNDPLTSIYDITHGIRKSPTHSLINAPMTGKDVKNNNAAGSGSSSSGTQGQNSGAAGASGKNLGNVSKRSFDISASQSGHNNSGNNNSNHKKSSKETPEMKRARSASTSSEHGNAKTPTQGKSGEAEIPLDLSGRSTRTSPPITIPQHHPRETSKSPCEKRAMTGKSPDKEKPAILITPTPPTSTAAALQANFLSPKLSTLQKNSSMDTLKAQPPKAISVSKLSPNQSSKISSIVDNLAQKQAQAQQQQQLQNMRNSRSPQQHQQQQQQHHQHVTSNSSALPSSSPNNSGALGNNSQNMKSASPGSGSSSKPPSISPTVSTASLTSPITATSLTSPVIPMTSPSPPGDPMRNLWTLSDTAARQGKMNPTMNELLVAAGMFSPPGHHFAGATAHQLAAAAAAMANSPSGAAAAAAAAGAFGPGMFAQFNHHFGQLGANPTLMAALNAHNAHAAGLRMHHPFVGSISPPLTLPNTFYPHGAPPGQQASALAGPATTTASSSCSLKIPSASPKSGPNSVSGGSGGGNAKLNAIPFAPLFSHSVPVSSPKSPTTSTNQVTTSAPTPTSRTPKSPTAAAAASASTNNLNTHSHSHSHPHSVSQFTSAASSNMLKQLSTTPHSSSTNPTAIQNQKQITHTSCSSAVKNSHHHHPHDSSSHSSSNIGSNSKSTKINGTVSTSLPVFPPGIHNPLLPSRSSSSSINSSAATAAATSKSFNALKGNPSRGAIPNSMKISNFLPNKPKDSPSDANAEATITSGSHFGMPPLQAKPNFSLCAPRCPPAESSMSSLNIPKSPSAFKESAHSPVKCAPAPPQLSSPPKPSSMTCASLLLPDSNFGKNLHPLSNNPLSSPTKLEHAGPSKVGLSRTHRSPSSDYALGLPPSYAKNFSSSLSPKSGLSVSKDEPGKSPEGPKSGSPPKIETPQGFSLNRPVANIPAFLNRLGTSSSSNSSLSSTSHSHHSSQSQVRRTPSPVKVPSPTKISQSEQQRHLPSPVFPFPGVSVPVQVKQQNDHDEVIPAAVTVASVPTSTSVSHSITLKSEVSQLLHGQQEEKVEMKRKRSPSPSHDTSAPVASGQIGKIEVSKSNLVTKKENCEVAAPKPKMQKVEVVSEWSESHHRLDAGSKGASRNESERAAAQREAGGEGETIRAAVAVVAGERNVAETRPAAVADPSSKELSVSCAPTPTSNSTAVVKTEREDDVVVKKSIVSPSQPQPVQQTLEAVAAPLLPPAAPVQVKTLCSAEKQTENEATTLTSQEEKSSTQIQADNQIPQSDQPSSQINNSPGENSLAIIAITEEKQATRVEEEKVKNESEKVQPEQAVEAPGQCEKNDVTPSKDDEMEVDVEGSDPVEQEMDDNEEKDLVIEERLTLTKEDEDIDVDVGVYEPLEVDTNEVLQMQDEDEQVPSDVTHDNDITMPEQLPETEPVLVENSESEQKLENVDIRTENEASAAIPTCTTVEVDGDAKDENSQSHKISPPTPLSTTEIIVEEESQALSNTENILKEEEILTKNDDEDQSVENSVQLEPPVQINETSNFSQDDSECGDLVIDLGGSESELLNNEVAEVEDETTEENEKEAVAEQENLDADNDNENIEEGESEREEICDNNANENENEQEVDSPQLEKVEQVVAEEVSENDENAEKNEMESLDVSEEKIDELNIVENEASEIIPETESADLHVNDDVSSSEVEAVESSETQENQQESTQQELADCSAESKTPVEENIIVNEDEKLKAEQEEEDCSSSTANENSDSVVAVATECQENSEPIDIEESEVEVPCAQVTESESKQEEAEEMKISSPVQENVPDEEEMPLVVSEKCEAVVEEEEKKEISEDMEIPAMAEATSEIETVAVVDMPAATATPAATSDDNCTDQVADITEDESIPALVVEDDVNMADVENEDVATAQEMQEESVSNEPTPLESQEKEQEDEAMEMEMEVEENITPEAEPPQLLEDSVAETEADVPLMMDTSLMPELEDIAMQTENENNVREELSLPPLEDEKGDEENKSETLTSENVLETAEIPGTITPVSPTSSCTTTTIIDNCPSVALKVGISANQVSGDDDVMECSNSNNAAPESLLPSATSSSSGDGGVGLPVPSSLSASGITSPSPVDISPATAAELKSLETFGKVTAGFLASATTTLNNNNNNTSLTPSTCDAISIATTNANA